MNDADLTEFFKNYVPNAASGDDKVYKFVGDPGEGGPGVEASLDIQYIMGVAPGENGVLVLCKQHFCGDLKNWTGMLLASDDVPLVHQFPMGGKEVYANWLPGSRCYCRDNDFAKLAAKGITIIFASGDSGSGYAPPTRSAAIDREKGRCILW